MMKLSDLTEMEDKAQAYDTLLGLLQNAILYMRDQGETRASIANILETDIAMVRAVEKDDIDAILRRI